MIFGECPYCEEMMFNYMPEKSPAFQKTECEECGNTVWLLCSRIESYAYTVEDFLEKYSVDEETKEVRKLDTEE